MNSGQVLKTLRSAQDFSALKDAVLKMCSLHGPALSYQLIFHSDKRSVSCLLEMKYPLPDAEMREFDAYGFGHMVCVDFDMASPGRQGLRVSADIHRAQDGLRRNANGSPKASTGLAMAA